MNQARQAGSAFRQMDELAAQKSPIHSLSPLAKFLTTVCYIIFVVSFDKYDLTAMSVFLLYPIAIFQISGIPISLCFYKLRVVMPLVCAVGIVNPFLDHTPVGMVGSVVITGGVVSMLSLMLKGVLSLMASFILVATTPMDSLCAALRKIHVPGMIVTLILLTYRYVTVMLDEVAIMTDAYHLRAPGQKGIHFSAWGSFLGQLLLRSMDKAQELYQSMQLRGFKGDFSYAEKKYPAAISAAFFLGWAAFFAASRYVNIPAWLGGLFVR